MVFVTRTTNTMTKGVLQEGFPKDQDRKGERLGGKNSQKLVYSSKLEVIKAKIRMVTMVTKGENGSQVFSILLVIPGFTLRKTPFHYAIQDKRNQVVFSVEMIPYIAKVMSTE